MRVTDQMEAPQGPRALAVDDWCKQARVGPSEYGLGPLWLIATDSLGLEQGDLALLLRSRDAAYAFVLVTAGTAKLMHYGYDAVLNAGDLVLLDLAATVAFGFAGEGELIALRVPARMLRRYLPSPDRFCGRLLSPDVGISRGVGELLPGILTALASGLPPEFHGRIARNLLDTLTTAFAIAQEGAVRGSPVIRSRNARARLKIEHNLRDPELTPASVAAQLRMSPRYLRAIFAASNETVSAYILRRRLEECARELADPRSSKLSITQIAFGWGFNSAPHFTRSFRKHYGTTPREFRAEGQTAQGQLRSFA